MRIKTSSSRFIITKLNIPKDEDDSTKTAAPAAAAAASSDSAASSALTATKTKSTDTSPRIIFREIRNTETLAPQQIDTIFSYKNISLSPQTSDIYRAGRTPGGYFTLVLKDLDKKPDGCIYREYGLKIQISLDDEIEGNIAKAWDSIVPILCFYHIARTKVINIRQIAKDSQQNPTEQGKQITIYASLHPDSSNWQNILGSITRALIKNQISPGYRPDPASSKELAGNCYISYRYDWDPLKKEYRPARLKEGAFPTGIEDPFKEYNIPGPAGIEPKTTSSSSSASSASTTNEFIERPGLTDNVY